jgi:hypothetical protein
MSLNAANQFIGKVFEDASLRDKLFTQVGDIAHVNLSQDVTAGESIVAIGQNWGYSFDLADLQSAYRGYIEAEATSTRGVLSERELELVAGGLSTGDELCSNTICEQTCPKDAV